MTRSRAAFTALIASVLSLSLAEATAWGQLRIVSYNTTGAPRTGMNIVLKSLGEELRNGFAKPVDVFLLQEQSRSAGLPNTQAFVNLLNNTIYAGQGITYARGNLAGAGDDTQTIVYRTSSVQLLEEVAVGTVSLATQPRQALRFKVKPIGYDDSAAFYLFNSHYKASQGTDSGASTSNAHRRLAEANAIRTSSDGLGQGTHVIYGGDFNFYDFDAQEPAFGALTAAGAGQANDPISRIGTWHNSLSYADVHTQSPTTTARFNGQVAGGMDDRFDFQLVTGEFQDGEGLSYLSGSYHAFGNNGSTYNQDIDSGANTYSFSGVTSYTKPQILGALASVTDHLPVVADYQIPAKMNVLVAAIPSTVDLGASVTVNVTVENVAPAIAAIGADELEYTLSVSGDLMGGASGMDFALGGGHVHQITLNTATPGVKNGFVTVTSNSQQVANGSFNLPVSFQVLPDFLEADFNENGFVDGVDLAALSTNLGMASSATKSQGDADVDGDVDGADFLVWQRQSGSPPGGTANLLTVPESDGRMSLTIGLLVACICRTKVGSRRRMLTSSLR